MNVSRCPKCAAPRGPGSECPRCGVIYAKAQCRAADAPSDSSFPPSAAADVDSLLPPEKTVWDECQKDAAWEQKLRIFAIPSALLVAWLVINSGMGRSLVRIFFSMWVHEFGHAVTAWLCGLVAIPGPWVTPVGEERSAFIGIVVSGGLVYLLWRSYSRTVWTIAVITVFVLGCQIYCSLVLSLQRAKELVIFGGDAGNMVLGVALMSSIYAHSTSSIRTGWTRWGFLVIGAFSFMDAFEQWWASRSNPDRIPYGENEGSGLSDPSKLVEYYGWSQNQMINTYFSLSLFCFSILIAVYFWGLWDAREPTK